MVLKFIFKNITVKKLYNKESKFSMHHAYNIFFRQIKVVIFLFLS